MVKINIAMPEVCGDCPFSETENHEYPWCGILHKDRGYSFDVNKKRFVNCPLIEDKKEENQANDDIDKMKNQIRVLQIRCMAATKAAMCIWCGMNDNCQALKEAVESFKSKEKDQK